MAKTKKSTTLSSTDWIEEALKILVEGQIDDVRVEVVARNLGVTKGGFYWHFKNRQDLLERMLQHWMNTATLATISRINIEADCPKLRLEQLITLPARSRYEAHGGEIELAIRSWARSSELAGKTFMEVDRIRTEYLRNLFRDLGFSETELKRRADVAHSFIVGSASLRYLDKGKSRLECAKTITKFLLS